jgi:putative endonuclease
MKHIVYILFSKKLNRFYTGYTSNLTTRMDFHRNAPNNKFTAKADDWELFYTIDCDCKKQALAIEKYIKRMKSSKYIRNLIIYPEITQKLLLKFAPDC